MALNIPLPEAPPGGLYGGLRAANALTASSLENQIKAIQAKYAPLTVQAEAMSKLAYANLMGPQFIAKLMANDPILANMSDVEKRNALSLIQNSVSGQNVSSGIFNQPNIGNVGGIVGSLLNLFQPKNKPSQSQIPSFQQTQQPIVPQSSVIQQQPTQPSYTPQPTFASDISEQPQTVQFPRVGEPASGKSWGQTVGEYKGLIEEGKESGKIRAEAIDQLDQQYQNAIQSEVPIKRLMQISQDPIFINMRNKIPFFQDKQLQFLAKTGTPAEQKLIGDFITDTTNAVANTVNSFGGRALVKEFDIGERMKISPNDTWNVMLGKLESISTFNEMTKQRSRIASKLMQKEHISRGDALERADKLVDGDKIRKKINNELNKKESMSQIKKEDREFMKQKYKIDDKELDRRLREKGII